MRAHPSSAPPPPTLPATPASSPSPAVPKVERVRVEGSRSSSRVKNLALARAGRETSELEAITLLDDDDEEADERRIIREERAGELAARLDPHAARPNPKVFGNVRGTAVGQWEPGRMAFSQRGVHAPVVAGISGNEGLGAWSVALSGGYKDDIDLGYSFTYTGSGGRDLKGTKAAPKNLRTAPQTSDQQWTALNLALKRSSETGKPIRVIRGFKCRSPFAPLTGYRYDGLYTLKAAWMDVGEAGFAVTRFAFVRLPGQPPLTVQPGREEEAAALLGEVDAERAELIRAGVRVKMQQQPAKAAEVAQPMSDEEEDEQVASELVGKAYMPPTPTASDSGSIPSQGSPTRKRKAAEPAVEKKQVKAKVAKIVTEGARRSTRVRA